MANTSRTMANRKRPSPTSAAAAAANGGPTDPGPGTNGNGASSSASAASSAAARSATRPPPPTRPLPAGIDALLARYARDLPPGGTVTVRLIKGPSSASVDPIAARKAAARRAAAAGGNAGGGGGGGEGSEAIAASVRGTGPRGSLAGAPLSFPRVAKFHETVTAPDFFATGSLKDGRMYEEEVPMAKDESDEDESTAYRPPSDGTGEGGSDANASGPPKKKKRRWRRNDARPRRWVLQEKSEFFERIRRRRQRGSAGGAADDDEESRGTSNQYHGVAESNDSKYVLFAVAPTIDADVPASAPSARTASEQIAVRQIHGFHTFHQPHKTASLTMEEAEDAIEKRRDVVTRYMMHGKLSAQGNSSEARAALASGVVKGGGRAGTRRLGPAPKAMSRARLLGRLAGGGGGDDDEDDVMGNVRFSSSRGGSSRARRELLSSMGDEGVKADGDGVLGGANDSEFGGRRRFMRVAADKDGDEGGGGSRGGKGGGAATTSTGFEAGAMEDGFYQRDVAAEYEALDYDANEQFDDDDVNVGEDEIVDDGGGFGGDYDSGDDNMMDSDEEEEGSDEDGFQGMATSSGMRAMLAKARGESPVDGAAPTADATDASAKGASEDGAAGGKGIDRMLDAAKKTAEEMEKKSMGDKNQSAAKGATGATLSPDAKAKAAVGIEKDKDGKRLITLEAIRREVWLNGGSITSKRLMKKFDVTSKNPDRQQLFKTIVMELCNMKKDADGSKKLVLKQHYSKI
ncbi:hypothetical protein ACHAWF_014034 [Thalassiosira exigua]